MTTHKVLSGSFDPISILLGAAIIVVVWIVKNFLRPAAQEYSKEKGKNLARKEDLDKLTAEVSAITHTTEEIKAAIFGDLWTRQAIWTMKREAYAELIASASEFAMALAADEAAGMMAKAGVPLHSPEITVPERRLAEANERFNRAFAVARIACDNHTGIVLEAHWPTALGLEGNRQVRELQRRAIIEARRELGISN